MPLDEEVSTEAVSQVSGSYETVGVGAHTFIRTSREDSSVLECLTCEKKGTVEQLEIEPCESKGSRRAGW